MKRFEVTAFLSGGCQIQMSLQVVISMYFQAVFLMYFQVQTMFQQVQAMQVK